MCLLELRRTIVYVAMWLASIATVYIVTAYANTNTLATSLISTPCNVAIYATTVATVP